MKIRDIYKLFKPYISAICIMIFFSILVSILNAVTPFVNRYLIDLGLVEKNIKIVFYCVLSLILLYLLDNIIQYSQTKQELLVANSIGKSLKVKALAHGLKMSPKYYEEQGFYKTIGDALYNIDSIMSIISSNCMIIVMIICKAAGAAVGLFVLNWRLALIIALLIPIKVLFNLWVRAEAERLGKRLMEAHKDYNSWFSDILSGIIDIKLWNLQSRKTGEYEGYVEHMNEATKNLSLLTSKNSRVMRMIELTFTSLMYLPGVVFMIQGEITLGSLVTFLSFSSYLLVPIDAIMDLRVTLKKIKPSVEDIRKFFDLEEENYASTLLPEKVISKIEFRDVSVRFENRMVLQNIRFTAYRGEKVALVGDNGSGKTTLIRLLLGLCEAYQGEILVNGIPIQEYNIEEYRKKFSVVSQNAHLFRGTVMDNILMDAKTASDSLARADFCTEAIDKLERGFDTAVGSEGTKLSGGERQKVALLRALNRRSQVLILDEATSNYDRESEERFNLFLRENRDYDFYFIVTHRKAVLSYVDKIVYLSSGKVTRVETAKRQS